MSFNDDVTLQWLAIRDLFVGLNRQKQNIKVALELARGCQHSDAQWLAQVFAGKNVSTRDEAKRVFLAQGDAQALCFAALMGDYDDLSLLRRSAEQGCAFAEGTLAGNIDGEESLFFALRAASKGEREGFVTLGFCYEHGEGCERGEGQ